MSLDTLCGVVTIVTVVLIMVTVVLTMVTVVLTMVTVVLTMVTVVLTVVISASMAIRSRLVVKGMFLDLFSFCQPLIILKN